MATALALRLRRLEAIRNAADQLTGRPQLGRDVFGRGAPEPIADIKRPEWTATLYDLLTAYAAQRQKSALAHVRFAPRTVWSLAEARAGAGAAGRRDAGLGPARRISSSPIWSSRRCARPCMASSFAAALEMVREGAARDASDAARSRRSSCASVPVTTASGDQRRPRDGQQ